MENNGCCRESGSRSIVTFLLGGVVGGILGLLYAPRRGEDMRGKIKFYAERAAEQAVERMQVAREDASSTLTNIRREFNEKKDRIASALDAGQRAFSEERDLLEENT